MLLIYFFVLALLGHMVGDYILQNQWMAVNKSGPGWLGHKACTVHVLLYTFAIALLTGVWNLPFLLAIAIPHWLIDRWSLATYLLRFKSGEGWKDTPFAPAVYIANDNTMHFLCIFLTLKVFGL